MIQGVGPIEDDAEYLDRFPGILAQSKFLRKENNLNFYLYPCFPQNGSENYKTIMFIGVTGSGKTSSINFFLNYYLGVKFEDNIRFQLIDEQLQGGSQYFSQTQNVNIYYVQPINGNDGLKIIDTPGFANERGILQDQIILDRIQNCFQKDIDQISAVCFLIKASDTRLTITQQYAFTQITKIFGKDIIKNLIFLFPFFDYYDQDEEPNALQMVKFKGNFKEQENILADIYDQMSEPKYIKYSNYLMQQKNTSYGKQEYWDDYMKQFNVFKEEKIEKILPVSLYLTKRVLILREQNLKIIKQLKTLINVQEYQKLTNEFFERTYRLNNIALNPQLTYEFESKYIQELLNYHNDKEKQILNEMLADFKMHDEQVIKNGDLTKQDDFHQQFVQARREGNLKGLLLNQP